MPLKDFLNSVLACKEISPKYDRLPFDLVSGVVYKYTCGKFF